VRIGVGDSLQEQLRALGLATEKPARDRKPAGKPGGKARGKGSGKSAGKPGSKPGARPSDKGAGAEPSLSRAYALRERQEQKEADAARRRKLAEDRRRREINERVRAIVDPNRQNRDDGEVARHFLFRGRIRKLYVTPEQQAALAAGELGIVYLTGSYHLLAAEHLDAVRGVDPEHVVDLDSGGGDEEEFPVPDDLDW